MTDKLKRSLPDAEGFSYQLDNLLWLLVTKNEMFVKSLGHNVSSWDHSGNILPENTGCPGNCNERKKRQADGKSSLTDWLSKACVFFIVS